MAEIRAGKAYAHPNKMINHADKSHPRETLLSVQSVVADAHNHLWILDTGSPEFQTPIIGGAKIVEVDLMTDKVIRTIVFDKSVVLPNTYLNDIRFDLRQGKAGVAYITDSGGSGAIIVTGLATGKAVRRLGGHFSTSPDPDFIPLVQGHQLMFRDARGNTKPLGVASDGIALSADGEMLYFCPLSSRHLYSVRTSALCDSKLSGADLAAQVVDLGIKGASDGIVCDNKG